MIVEIVWSERLQLNVYIVLCSNLQTFPGFISEDRFSAEICNVWRTQALVVDLVSLSGGSGLHPHRTSASAAGLHPLSGCDIWSDVVFRKYLLGTLFSQNILINKSVEKIKKANCREWNIKKIIFASVFCPWGSHKEDYQREDQFLALNPHGLQSEYSTGHWLAEEALWIHYITLS